MGGYTEEKENAIMETDPESEHYKEDLISIVRSFRRTGNVLDEYIKKYGYKGSLSDTEEKAAYTKKLFKEEGIPVPRELKAYFREHKKFSRKTAYQFCFALKLDADETRDFFKRCYLGRGFDFHVPEEVICYYCIKHRLPYSKAEELIGKTNHVKQGKVCFSEETIYTSQIENELHQIDTERELTEFINISTSRFEYRNATACRYIRDIWQQITDPENGLLTKEIDLKCSHDFEKKEKPGKLSLETAYIWMLGLEDMDLSDVKRKRSLKEIIKDNSLMHPIAEESFPDRNAIKKVLQGEPVSYEGVQKILILLLFYRHWAKKAVSGERYPYRYAALKGEAQRCRNEMNRYLKDAGYTELYSGNPYDWIFLFSMYDDYPLDAFRDYMRELYLEKQDQALV